jgi:SagB-type dehydrogenase family enzyme
VASMVRDSDSPRQKLRDAVELLSDDESDHLLGTILRVVSGERYWESDIAVLYNEYVKARYFDLRRDLSSIIPAGPAHDDEPFAPIPLVKPHDGATRLELGPTLAPGLSVVEAIAGRRSRRDYLDAPVSLERLSTLLHFGAGTTGHGRGYGYAKWPLRSFPSSGGLQVPEFYVAIRNVSGVDPGLYHYAFVDHALELIRPGDHDEILAAIAIGQPYVATAAFVLVVTGCYDRASWKYGERAFRYLCMDVGFAAENLYLVGEALGLGVCAVAGFIDDALERLLGLEPRAEFPMLLVTVGPLDERDVGTTAAAR